MNRWLAIEQHNGAGWHVLAEAEAPMDVTLPEIILTLRTYAGDGEARALVDGSCVASTTAPDLIPQTEGTL